MKFAIYTLTFAALALMTGCGASTDEQTDVIDQQPAGEDGKADDSQQVGSSKKNPGRYTNQGRFSWR